MHGLSFDSSFDVGTCILAPEIDVHPEFLQSSQSSQKIHAVAAEAAAWLGAVSSESSLTAKFPCPRLTLILLENESNFSCRKNYRHTRTYRTKALLVTVQRSTMVKPAEVISSSISTQVIMTSFLVIRLEEAMIAFCWVWVTWENKP